MSIEQQLSDLTAAIKELTAAVQAAAPEAPAVGKPEKAARTPPAEAKAVKPEPATESPSEGKSSSGTTKLSAASAAPVDTGAELTYKGDVAPLFSKLVAKDRPAAIELLEHYKVLNEATGKTLGDVLKPVQFKAVIDKIQALLD